MRAMKYTAVALCVLLVACSSAAGPDGTSGTADAGPGNGADPGPDDGGTGPSEGGTAPFSGSCAVTKKGTAGLVLQGTILAPSGPLVGEVLVDASGKITCVDKSCAASAGYAAASVLACPDGVISPSLINGHDQTEYNTAPPVAHGTTRWMHRNGWRTGAAGEMKISEPKRTTDVTTIAAAELRFLLGGATTVNGSGAAPGLLRNVASRTNADLEGLTGPHAYFDTFPLGDTNGTELASGCAYPSVRSSTAAFASGGAYSPHISEGINPAAENEFACLKDTLVTSDTAIIHAVGLNATDINVIKTANAKVIWSARTNVDLYGNTAPVTVLKNMGVTIGLGTDWLASGSMNMLRELACVDSLNQKYFNKAFDDRAIFEMATKNAAIALKVDSQIGELAPGKLADIAIFSAVSQKDYRAVLEAGVEDVLLVLRGGKPLYGESAIIDALQPGCSDLAVCSSKKKVCIDTPNVTLAAIQKIADASYPLFFCKTAAPMGEPSCVPYRDTYPLGTSATDRDGDGVPDAQDNCPDVFNPPRGLDGTAQADVDGDTHGDACDLFPLDAAKH